VDPREEILALARETAADARAAHSSGDTALALRLYARAEKLRLIAEELPSAHSSGNLSAAMELTPAQLARRGRAIARSRAGDDKLLLAINGSKWGSQERYARERLGISPPSLQAYRDGKRPCPKAVADLVMADFGLPASFWRKGVVS
jgi:hypothetical protein